MTSQPESSRETSQPNPRYVITPSLLNSWGRIWEAPLHVVESDSDDISLEDKMDEASEKAKAEFVKVLNKVPLPDNEWMKAGRDFEEECYEGKTCVSPIIEGGAFQIVGTKKTSVNGVKVLMYGRLDVLKGGTIYDIKRVQRYSVQKYLHSYQHGFYMDLFPNAEGFTYLVFDGNKLHQESYFRGQYRPTEEVISDFLRWLKANGLYETFKDKWKAKGE